MQGSVLFTKNTYGGQSLPVMVSDRERLSHLHILGRTGSGKSTTLINLAIQDILQGRGLTFIDVHGSHVETLLECIPRERVGDTLYFDAGNTEHIVGFNPFTLPYKKHVLESFILNGLKGAWSDSWGARMEYILSHAIHATLSWNSCRGKIPNFLILQRILSDDFFRKKVVSRIKDPLERTYWRNEFDNYPKYKLSEYILPIQNKVGVFSANPILRYITAHRSIFDPLYAMNQNQIVLVNLNKGAIGLEASSLLGSLIVAMYGGASYTRGKGDVTPHFLYLDEFHNFVTDSLDSLLSESRGFGLGLVLANQYLDQLSSNHQRKIKESVLGNVGTRMCFRCGTKDSEALSREMSTIGEDTLSELDRFHVVVKSEDGRISKGMSLPPIAPLRTFGRGHRIKNNTKARLARSKEIVDKIINRSVGIK